MAVTTSVGKTTTIKKDTTTGKITYVDNKTGQVISTAQGTPKPATTPTPTSTTPTVKPTITNNTTTVAPKPTISQPTAPKPQPTDSETLKYLQNKLDYINNGSVSNDQSMYNMGYRNNYNISETDPTKDDLLNKISTLQYRINQQNQEQADATKPVVNDPLKTTKDIFGIDPSTIQDTLKRNAITDANAEYNPQITAVASKLKSLLETYNNQKLAENDQYKLSQQEQAQQNNDIEFEQREALNRLPGTVAEGLQGDLLNKLKRAAIMANGRLSADHMAKLREIDTNSANISRESAEQIAALQAALGQKLGAAESKAFMDYLNTVPGLITNASNIDTNQFNKLMKLNEYNNITLPEAQQSQELNQINILKGQYDLNELKDPNSMTNKIKQSQYEGVLQDLEKGKITLANLPEQMRLELAKLADEVTLGKLNVEWFPKKMAAEIAATNRSNRDSGGSGGSSIRYTDSQIVNTVEDVIKQYTAQGQPATKINPNNKKSYWETPKSTERQNTMIAARDRLLNMGVSPEKTTDAIKPYFPEFFQ